MFKRTSLPVARSIHYQLIDIQLDEVQQMVHSNDGQVRNSEKKNSPSSSFFLLSLSLRILKSNDGEFVSRQARYFLCC